MTLELAEWEEKFSDINEADMTTLERMSVLGEYYRIIEKINKYAL